MARAPRQWIVCQIGAREHYALARGLHRRGALDALVTDAWLPADSWLSSVARIGQGLRQRHHLELDGARVHSFTAELLAFELRRRLARSSDPWAATLRRNQWFQRQAARVLRRSRMPASQAPDGTVVCSYSYAAEEILREARNLGLPSVLCQIDGGPAEEDLVAAHAAESWLASGADARAPAAYWDGWRRECELADGIVVNSGWSRDLLLRAGVPAAKLATIPLMYEPPSPSAVPKDFPQRFDERRPLRMLFLGTVCLRKGVQQLIEAVRRLPGMPIEYWIVGPATGSIPRELRALPALRWIDRVPRSAAASYYRRCDVFLFPTLSDGFGITQLEAQSAGMPVIASHHCGAVVDHGRNGLLLQSIAPDKIASAIQWCFDHPEELARMSRESLDAAKAFAIEALMPRFESLLSEPSAA